MEEEDQAQDMHMISWLWFKWALPLEGLFENSSNLWTISSLWHSVWRVCQNDLWEVGGLEKLKSRIAAEFCLIPMMLLEMCHLYLYFQEAKTPSESFLICRLINITVLVLTCLITIHLETIWPITEIITIFSPVRNHNHF